MLVVKIKLILEAGKASLNPNLGSVLGQYGININLFCKEFNNKTNIYKNLFIPVSVYIYNDKSFKLKIHFPSVIYLFNYYSINNILKLSDFIKIIILKKIELYPMSYINVYKIIVGTLKSMKLKIKI